MSISTRLYGIPSRASARRTLELFPDRCSEESVYIQNKIRMREAYPRAGSSRSRSNRNVYRAAPPKRYSNDRTDKVWQLQGHTRIHKNIKCVRCSAASAMQISRAAVNGNFILGHFLATPKIMTGIVTCVARSRTLFVRTGSRRRLPQALFAQGGLRFPSE